MSTVLTADARPIRILFVFAWLVVGGEETEVRLLAQALDPTRYRIEVVACFRKDGMPEQTHAQLEAIGVPVDRTPYALGFDETVAYLASKLPAYDVVVSCQNVADIYPALERMHLRPPLIEHGGLVSEALAGPKHLTARYVGVCASIRDAAAGRMPGREHHAIEIPSMVDTRAFDPVRRAPIRATLGIAEDVPLIGWLGRLDPKKRVEDFIEAAAVVHARHPRARFVVIGGPDAFIPEYAAALRNRAHALGLDTALTFLGDRDDVPDLLAALDIFVWLSRGEGMPHVIAEAGAARLPVIATRDNGSEQQIVDGVSGLFVPHEDPPAVATAITKLIEEPALRTRLGTALRAKVDSEYAVAAVVPRWEALFAEVLTDRPPLPRPTGLFRSFLQGGFESSTHRRAYDRKRVDVIAASHHDTLAAHDYSELAKLGILTVRDGLRWHLIEREPGRYDWSSLDRQLEAAKAVGTEVIWDLLHYGWPDNIDIWTPTFVTRFAAFAAAAARHIGPAAPGETRFYAPVNEISFFAWGGGDAAYLNPFARGRGYELKVQLARASIAAMEAILAIDPAARFVHADPVINVITDPARPNDAPAAEGHRLAQYQAWDMIAGKAWPQIGGRLALLDIVGVNFYHNNQWIHGGPPLAYDHPLSRPLHAILADAYARYGRPIFIAETGIEGSARPAWLRMILREVRIAQSLGVPVEGTCLYPILDHPGWDDDRYCPNGLLACSPIVSNRIPHAALADVIRTRPLLVNPESA
ncbi:glycosyltransferase family 4 protein [Sphingomonas sp. PP-CC-3A-396]|uniref:glycosyltransferase family 4 protein n=1 Tax=Sphingomonas sp. PP-CC-3A-396 TaxID=2135655 RepID=UPI00104DEED8|nr:glycosyltransferase family 4 protein [Sphingomonas sp. PP-CC-3A-396]TCQ03209.1 glycosyltransferase involved in cell wall biosynthesis [Sphingomonas sp. PP-CC-3A-396]